MMKPIIVIIGATLALAACGGDRDSEESIATDETIVDEDYDANADSLEEAMAEVPLEEMEPEDANDPPPPPPAREIDPDDVMAEDPETDDVVGL